jgi:hypothetical protein
VVGFVQDLVFATCLLLTSFGVGLPLARLLSPSYRMRLLAAPGLGFGVVALMTTLTYRYGMSLTATTLGLVSIAVVMMVWRFLEFIREDRSIWVAGGIAATAGLTLLLCLLPKWTGGAQFAAFQGNPIDHLSYLSEAISFRKYCYIFLQEFNPDTTINNFVGWVAGARDARPGVAIVLAAFVDLMRTSAVERSYVYLATLQAMMFFPATFLILNVFRTSPMLAAAGGVALTLGFPMQYVLDINAWSELAALPIAVLSVALVIISLQPDKADQSLTIGSAARWILVLSTVLASLLYLYPEVLVPYGAAFVGAIGLWLLSGCREKSLSVLGIGAASVVFGFLLCAPYYEGTIGFLVRQFSWGFNNNNLDWWRYFQAYLFGHQFSGAIVPLNFGLALIGLYPILPQAGFSQFIIMAWQLVDAVIFIGVLTAAFLAWTRARRDMQHSRPWLLLAATGLVCAFLIAVLSSGRFWTAGKGLSMTAPLIFFVLSAPLFYPKAISGQLRIMTGILWASYLLFGLIRPVAAHDNGLHYAPPYPSGEPHSKSHYSWNVEQYREIFLACRAISVDVDNAFLERYLQLYLIELGTNWFSVHPLDNYFGMLPSTHTQRELENPDCFITTAPVMPRFGTVINLNAK